MEKAEAEKIAVVKAAEGDAESKYLQGQVSSVSVLKTCHMYLPFRHQRREHYTVFFLWRFWGFTVRSPNCSRSY